MDTPIPNTPTPAGAKKSHRFSVSTCKAKLLSVHKEYGFLWASAIIAAILMYLMYLARLIHPFGDSTVLVLDLNGQYVYFYEGLRSIFFGEGSLFYSFCRALGGEFMGMFDYYVASPLSLIVALFPKDRMQEALLCIFLIKTALCSVTMSFYLYKHSVSRNKLIIITFGLMYALSSYAIIQQHNSMWIDAVMWLPILAYAIEEMIKRGPFRLYVFTLAITLISNFYIGYMVCIFTVAYCFYYYFAHNELNRNNPTGEKNHFLRSVGRVLLWSVLAVGIAAFIILTARYSLSMGKDEFSTPKWEITQKFNLFELLYKFLPSSYDTVRPAGLPFVYCGVLTVMLVPAFFLCKKFSNREKIAAALFILFFIGSFATSTLDLIWHGFQKPNWLNYRYSFMLCFFLLVLAFRAFEHLEYTSRKALLGVTAFVGLVVLVIQELGSFMTESNEKLVIRPFATIWLTLGCLVAYFIIISLWGKAKGNLRNNLAIILAFLVCVEVFLSGLSEMNSFDKDVTYSKYSRYTALTDTFLPITDKIYENDDGFFRMEKTYHRKKNDNFALNIKGLSNSTSTLNRDTLDFIENMGYSAKSHWAQYGGGTPVNDSLLGIKYLITDRDMSHYYGDPVYTKEDYGYAADANVSGSYDVYLNPYVLSMLVGVSDAWESFDPEAYDNPFDRLNAMVTAMLGETETVEIFVPAVQNGDPALSDGVKHSNIAGHHKYEGDKGTLTYEYTVPTDTELYYYFPSDYPREVDLKFTVPSATQDYFSIKGKSETNFGGSETQRIVSLGQLAPKTAETADTTTAKLEVTIDNGSKNLYIKEGWDSCVYYIDWDVFTEAMATLQEGQVTLDNSSVDDHLTGSVTTAGKRLIYTSIPYDEGWKVKVDGKSVETVETAGALLAFYVEDAGEHDIDLRYLPDVYVLGLAVSGISLLIFLLLLLLYPWLKKMPVVKHFMGIQRPDLAPADAPEDLLPIEAGDLGYEEPPAPPLYEAVVVPPHDPEIPPEQDALSASILKYGIMSVAFGSTGLLAILGVIFSLSTKAKVKEYRSKYGNLTPRSAVGKGLGVAGLYVSIACAIVFLLGIIYGVHTAL